MIKTLTPYYITIPRVNPSTSVTCGSYTFELYVWMGNKSAIPSTPDYGKTRINASNTTNSDIVDISKIVNSFIEFDIAQSLVTSLEFGNNQYWVMTKVYYDDQPTVAQLENIELATRGYGYFLEGQNPQIPANKILLEGDNFKVNRNGLFVLPILMDEPTPVTPTLVIDSIEHDVDDLFDITFTTNIIYDEIRFRYRLEPATIWTFGDETITESPFSITIPYVSGTYNVQIRCYDPLSGNVVFSNIYDLIIP